MFSIVLLVVMLAVTWLLIIRPQQARVRRHASLVASINEGDRVVTSAGIIGTVIQIDDEQVIIFKKHTWRRTFKNNALL